MPVFFEEDVMCRDVCGKMYVLLIYVVLMYVMVCCSSHVFANVNWVSSYQQALQTAQQQHKPIFIYFYSPGINPCVRFDRETLANEEVISFLNHHFISLRVNTEQDRTMASRFGLFRVPTIMIQDYAGNEFLRLITFYPADKLLASLREVTAKTAPQAATQPRSGGTFRDARAIFYEPFETLYGWGSEGSSENSMAQISLVPGIKGNAFKVDYELRRDQHNYIQIHRALWADEQMTLPQTYTVIFHLAGTGGRNNLDLKFADDDGTNVGIVFPLPTDFKDHTFVLTSDQIKYLWGGKNTTLDKFSVFLIAVSPIDATNPAVPSGEKGAFFIDEMMILPGIHKGYPSGQ